MKNNSRTFNKLVIGVVVFAILFYFRKQASEPGTVKFLPTSRSNGEGSFDSVREIASKHPFASAVRGRDLKWINSAKSNGSDRINLGLSQDTGSGNGNPHDLTDDDDNDVECSHVHKIPSADRCAFVNSTDDCQIDEGFIDYTTFVYCDFRPKLLPLGLIVIIIWWAFLFVGLAVTTDDFFCPSLAVISQTMRLSHNIAGVTILAFGNGAPDIFSAIAAIGNAKNGDAGLAIGALFGAGVFVTTVVAGTIAIICPFDSMQRPFLRDVIFYLAAVFWTFDVLWDKQITKVEAVGFVILYVLYVIVVVVGRYLYTRGRNAQGEGNIQEPSGFETVNPLDTDLSGERQPLLTNPDIISLSAVRDQTKWQEFLHHINPIDVEDWSGKSLFKKFYEIFKSPLMFVLIITIPVVNYEEDKHHWNRYLYCIQIILGPMFAMFATKAGTVMIGGSFPVWGLVLIIAVLLAILVFFTSSDDEQPKYHAVFAYIGFVVAVVWIYSIANEIVNILQTFGIVCNISNAILGLTLLAWGNSLGDMIADTVMARQGFPRMGISACFGGPLFNLLLGIGIPFTIATVKNPEPYQLKITLEEVVLGLFLTLSLVSSLIIVPLSRFRMSRPWGIYLLVLYVVFLVIAILTEVNVIHADIDNNPI